MPTRGRGLATNGIAYDIKTALKSAKPYATFLADSTVILPEGIGLCGLEILSIEISAISFSVFPAAMKQIAEVV